MKLTKTMSNELVVEKLIQNQNSQIHYVGGHVNCKLSYFYTFCMAGPL